MTNNHADSSNYLANLSNDEQGLLLLQALAANDAELHRHSPDTNPVEYAVAKGNRGLLLQDLANLPSEDRRARLLQALAAFDEALLFFSSDTNPLDYAGTQNNRGLVLSALANLSNEDRQARLLQSLAAYDEAVRFRQPETVPLEYAAVQSSRGLMLSALADLPGEDRRALLERAAVAYAEALQFYDLNNAPFEHAAVQINQSRVLCDLAKLSDENRFELLNQALGGSWSALAIFQRLHQDYYAQLAANTAGKICVQAGEFFPTIWDSLNGGEIPTWLTEYVQWQRVPSAFRAATQLYGELRKRADAEDTVVAWQQVIAIGQQIALLPNDDLPAAIHQIHANAADAWHNLGFLFYKLKRMAEAQAAFGEAIRLQPDVAHWYCDRATTDLRLGYFVDAKTDLARAAELDPEQPRLEKLRQELNDARLQRDVKLDE